MSSFPHYLSPSNSTGWIWGAGAILQAPTASDDQPPSSLSTIGGVPFIVCQLAQTCRRSCHRNPSKPARLTAFNHPVLTLPTGALPLWSVKTYSSCLPTCAFKTSMTAELSGTEIGFLDFDVDMPMNACLRFMSTADHLRLATAEYR